MSDRFDQDDVYDDEAEADQADDLDEIEEEGGPGITRYVIIALVGLIGLIILGLIVAIVGAVVNSDGVAHFFTILRDFFIIVLALQGILISVALVVLVLQLSALINLLENEIRPLIEETRETLTTVSGTTKFVSQNVTTPVIRVASAMTGARTLLRELSGIRRNVSGDSRK